VTVTKEEFNGLGNRVNDLAMSHAETKTKTEANEKGIDKLGDSIGKAFDKMDANYVKFSAKTDSLGTKMIYSAVILVGLSVVKDLLLP